MCRKWLPLFAFLPGLWPAAIGLHRMNRNSSIPFTSFFVSLALRHRIAGLLPVPWHNSSLMHSISKTHFPGKNSPNWAGIHLPDRLYINSTGTVAFSTATGISGLYNYSLIVDGRVRQTRRVTVLQL
ncbi:MAG TPA: hypothetical protein VK666_23320 [Chryseolinea sp.]|nr:hypothetical protein [Chryseolinea sp.]